MRKPSSARRIFTHRQIKTCQHSPRWKCEQRVVVTSDIRWLDPRSYPCSKLRPKGQLLRHSSRYGTINEILVLASACHATVAEIHANHTSIHSTYSFIYTHSRYIMLEKKTKAYTEKQPGIFRELNEETQSERVRERSPKLLKNKS